MQICLVQRRCFADIRANDQTKVSPSQEESGSDDGRAFRRSDWVRYSLAARGPSGARAVGDELLVLRCSDAERCRQECFTMVCHVDSASRSVLVLQMDLSVQIGSVMMASTGAL